MKHEGERAERKSKMDRRQRQRHSLCSFFKLMLSPPSMSHQLRIPKCFARKVFGRNDISSTAILAVPTGETREVALVREGNELCFRDGWKDFVERFSIRYAYFILFKYKGNFNFMVHIFDLTACEISYPCNNVRDTDTDTDTNTSQSLIGDDHNTDDDDDEKPEILHKSPVMSKESEAEVIQLDSDDDDDEIMNDVEEQHNNPFVYPFWMKKFEELMKGVVGAGISLPENPFFVAPIKPYVLNKSFLNVPKPFCQEHIGHQTRVIKLEAHDGRQWEVRCVRDSTKYSLRTGWMVFARAVGLQIGDVCVFELVDVVKYVLKVHVAKKSEIKVAQHLNLTFEEEE